MTLDEYLREVLPQRQRESDTISLVGLDVISTFCRAYDAQRKAFPYEVRSCAAVAAPEKYSYSTNAMVLFALGILFGRGRDVTWEHAGLRTPLLSGRPLVSSRETASVPEYERARDRLNGIYDVALQTLRERIGDINELGRSNQTSARLTTSGTFGPDDPFTLCWALEVFPNDEIPQNWLDVATEVSQRVTNPQEPVLRRDDQTAGPHALPLLRLVHLYERLRDVTRQPRMLGAVRDWFENNIHQNLSYANIPDSTFDAPELLFSLEGLLICDSLYIEADERTRHTHAHDRLVERIATVLAEKQQNNPNLRPYRPVIATREGLALLPITIEVFNATLRVLERIGDTPARAVFGGVLSRYVQWLVGQRVTITSGAGDVSGWHSEHTHAADLIHVWETSQVLLFLFHYRSWLHTEVQREIMATGAFSVKRRPRLEKWMPNSAIEAARREIAKHAPIYEPLWRNYIAPRIEQSDRKSFSMLLYGPPGTGKSTIAEFVAAALKWPMITITPSDFIVRGGELVEERAKAIFRALEELSNVVILFDEIDQLLLDRDGPAYRQQGDVFRLMTPSMLPKLKDLRDRAEVIFIIATNLYEEIDAAVKRPGRIDDRFLVLPPDASARKLFLEEGMRDKYSKGEPSLVTFGSDSEGQALLTEAVKRTALYPFTQLRDIAKDSLGRNKMVSPSAFLTAFIAELDQVRSDIRLGTYQPRLNAKDATIAAKVAVRKELCALARLKIDGPGLTKEEQQLFNECEHVVAQLELTL